jgi:hypothetical protein
MNPNRTALNCFGARPSGIASRFVRELTLQASTVIPQHAALAPNSAQEKLVTRQVVLYGRMGFLTLAAASPVSADNFISRKIAIRTEFLTVCRRVDTEKG